ncbi:MAG: PH domain-containing protein [Nitrospinota bacterium]|nr:PH domain-containing protein [Nitrospinota bacterium]
MGYVDKTLAENEKIVFRLKYHWSYTLTAFLWLLFFGLLIIGVIQFLRMMINKWTTERVLTAFRLIKKTGWISRKIEKIRVARMEEINLSQSFWGRIFGVEKVKVTGAGRGTVDLVWLSDPIGFQKTLNNAKFKS